MIQAIRHLHEAKIEEIAEKLRDEGYATHRVADAGHDQFDLVAEKDGRKLAVIVKDATELRAASKDVMRLRKAALDKGFDEFRLFVANRPRKKNIVVPGLEAILFTMTKQGPIEDLKKLSDRTVVKRIHGVDVESIAMESGGVHVMGSAVAVAELNYASTDADPLTLVAEFPMSFDLRLNSDLTLRESVFLRVDTASFTGP